MSRQLSTIAVAIGWSLAVGSLAAPPGPGIRIAAVRDGAVCVSVEGSALRCFGAASSKARLPVWSRDGTRIAYVEDANSQSALASLVVIDQHGQVQSRTAIKPVASGEVRSGMRFVEALDWVGSDRVVVSGSINPSSTESLLVDLLRGAVVGEYVDDARGASFSPDGKHVVTVDGAPHFTAPGARAPVLRLDGHEVLTGLHTDLSTAGRAKWSADGITFALAAQEASGRMRLVLGHAASNSARWVDLPFAVPATNKAPTLFWSGNDLHLQRTGTAARATAGAAAVPAAPGARNLSIEDQVLSAGQRSGTWKRSAEPSVDPARAAAGLRSAVLAKPLQTGVRDVDVWCTGCALDRVSRRSGIDAD